MTRLARLAGDFPAWEIKRVSLRPTWIAVMSHDTLTHVIASHNLDELRAKPANADMASRAIE